MTDDEQQIAQAIAQAFETLSERLSKELEDALNQMAPLMERAQKQQYEIMSIFGKQAAAMEALADFVAKARNDDVNRHNGHRHRAAVAGPDEDREIYRRPCHTTRSTLKALSNRLDAVEKEAFGPNYNQQPSTPPLN